MECSSGSSNTSSGSSNTSSASSEIRCALTSVPVPRAHAALGAFHPLALTVTLLLTDDGGAWSYEPLSGDRFPEHVVASTSEALRRWAADRSGARDDAFDWCRDPAASCVLVWSLRELESLSHRQRAALRGASAANAGPRRYAHADASSVSSLPRAVFAVSLRSAIAALLDEALARSFVEGVLPLAETPPSNAAATEGPQPEAEARLPSSTSAQDAAAEDDAGACGPHEEVQGPPATEQSDDEPAPRTMRAVLAELHVCFALLLGAAPMEAARASASLTEVSRAVLEASMSEDALLELDGEVNLQEDTVGERVAECLLELRRAIEHEVLAAPSASQARSIHGLRGPVLSARTGSVSQVRFM